MSCNVKDCESGSQNVYCPNRFTFDEMFNIKMALHLAPGMIEDFMESADYKTLKKQEKIMFDNGLRLINEMEKLEEKVDDLLEIAIT